MRKKLLIKSMGITMMIATIALLTLCTLVSAELPYYDWDEDFNTDGATWQVTAQVVCYYYDEGEYLEILHQSWRGCISPVEYTEDKGLVVNYYGWGPYGYYDTGYQELGDETGPYYYHEWAYPYDWWGVYMTGAGTYTGAWFDIGGIAKFKPIDVEVDY